MGPNGMNLGEGPQNRLGQGGALNPVKQARSPAVYPFADSEEAPCAHSVTSETRACFDQNCSWHLDNVALGGTASAPLNACQRRRDIANEGETFTNE